MPTYEADPAEFAKSFPERIAEPPKLLLDFADWIRDKPWGSIGCFDLDAGWSDDMIFGGERFFQEFALFMKLPEGSRVGCWLKDGVSPEAAPIVLFGSEGQYETLGANLPDFLMRLGAADFLDSAAGDLLPDFENEEDDDDDSGQRVRDAFAEWISEQVGLRSIGGFFKGQFKGWLAKKLKKAPEDAFVRWAETEGRRPEIEQETDPRIAALTQILEASRPGPAEDEWARTMISIGWAGEHVEIVDASHGHKPVAGREAMIPLLAALRDGEAERTAGLGLWHAAWLAVPREGPATLQTDYRFEPRFFLGRPDDAAFRADQERMPRTRRRVPDWLEPMLKG